MTLGREARQGDEQTSATIKTAAMAQMPCDRCHCSRDDGPSCRAYADLLKQYTELQQRHAQCEARLRHSRETATRYKQRAKEWFDFIRQSDLCTPRAPPGQRLLRVSPTNIEPSAAASGVSSPTAEVPQDMRPARFYATLSSSTSPQAIHRNVTSMSSRHGTNSRGVPSSQTTVVDPDSEPAERTDIKNELRSDDEPVVVSSRCLKRKRTDQPRPEMPDLAIKSEPASTQGLPPAFVAATTQPQSSVLDLDIVGSPVQTPRRPTSARRRHSGAFVDGAIPVDQSLLQGAASRANGLQHPATVLRDISTNIPKHSPRDLSHSAKSARKVHRTGLKEKVSMLAEDGEELQSAAIDGAGARKPFVQELKHMLESPAARIEALTPRSTVQAARVHDLCHAGVVPASEPRAPHASTGSGRQLAQTPSARQPKPASPLKGPHHFVRTKRAKHTRETSPRPARPEDEPLRIRPVEALRLEDFKINPRYMGTDHAFADTLRGRDQRRDLHTCTRPDCCGGAFEKIIKMGGTAMSGKTDAEALEMYLGPTWTDVLSSFGPAKRKELTEKAHVHAFAEKHGKHKHAFERRSTPPGFWRTDMPTTQEACDDRAEATTMEMRAIEERWREALRPGGRWLFRDE